jgi:hypothetical protein
MDIRRGKRPREEEREENEVDRNDISALQAELAQERQRAEQERQRAEQERQRAEQERQRAEQERLRADALELEILNLRANNETNADSRLKFFTSAVGGSDKSLNPKLRESFNSFYRNRCLFCDSSNNLSRAHLVVGRKISSDFDYDDFGTKKGYKNNIEVDSMRNYILLCGNRGSPDTCHDDFDNYLVTLLYNPLKTEYSVYHLNPLSSRQTSIHHKVVTVPLNESVRPYTRLLSWRTRFCLLEHGYLCKSEDVNTIVRLSEISEESKSVGNQDYDDDDNNDGEEGMSSESSDTALNEDFEQS